MAAPAWAGHVAVYCDLSAPGGDAAHAAAREALEAALRDGSAALLDMARRSCRRTHAHTRMHAHAHIARARAR
jgi:hypothetical protein